MGLEQLQKAAEQIENSVPVFDPYMSVTADADFIYFPGMNPKPRKKTNVWRDATEAEIAMHVQVKGTVIEPDDTTFFDEFMAIADKELMKNLNPTILNAL